MSRAVVRICCQYCGREIDTTYSRRMYCSERCARDAQNERRREERAEAREIREATHWDHDPWDRNDIEHIQENWEEIYSNALLDPPPDPPWDWPAAPAKKHRKKEKNPGWLWLPGVPMCPDRVW